VHTLSLATACANGMTGVDTNADHFALYLLDPHGRPVPLQQRPVRVC
jgi:hypothetical protein